MLKSFGVTFVDDRYLAELFEHGVADLCFVTVVLSNLGENIVKTFLGSHQVVVGFERTDFGGGLFESFEFEFVRERLIKNHRLEAGDPRDVVANFSVETRDVVGQFGKPVGRIDYCRSRLLNCERG